MYLQKDEGGRIVNLDAVRDLISTCRRWHEGLLTNKGVYYSRLEVSEGATQVDVDAVEKELGASLCPELRTLWSECATVDFEWFVKQRAAQEAGIDSRHSPQGTFRLLSPQEAIKEREFLIEVSDSHDENARFTLPFCRVGEHRQILAVNHAEGQRYNVELVVFDSDLNRLKIAAQFQNWLLDWHSVLFEEHHLVPGLEIAHATRVIVDVLAHFDFEWPPAGLKETPFESG